MNGTLQPVLSKEMENSRSRRNGFYATPSLPWDRATMTGKPFFYFAYGAAVSEVIVDTLTGEHRLLAVDVLIEVAG